MKFIRDKVTEVKTVMENEVIHLLEKYDEIKQVVFMKDNEIKHLKHMII